MSQWVDVGVGGAVAMLILDRVFNFLKTKGKNGTAGEKSTDYWRMEFRQAMTETIEQQLGTTLADHGMTLKEIRDGIKTLVTLEESRQRSNHGRS